MNPDGTSKGYGYVHFETAEAAKKVVEATESLKVNETEVEVLPYQKRERRPGVAEWTNLYVKNIPLEMSDADFKAMFEEFGEVTSAKVMTVTDSDVEKDKAKATPRGLVAGKSKGFGFVAFGNHEAAAKAAQAMNGKVLEEAPEGEEPKKLFVGRAMKAEERQRDLRKKIEQVRQNKFQAYQGVNLYIKNLEDSVEDKDLHREFESFGTITSARVMRDAEGVSKGFGFVCFSQPEEATAASSEMNGKSINGKPIFVTLAQRREQRREMLANSQYMNARGAGVNMMRGVPPMAGQMFGSMPMMYQGMPGARGPYMPMMMPRGMPRGGQMYARGQQQYPVPMYPAGPMQGNQQHNNRRRNNRQQGPGGRNQNMRQGGQNAQVSCPQIVFIVVLLFQLLWHVVVRRPPLCRCAPTTNQHHNLSTMRDDRKPYSQYAVKAEHHSRTSPSGGAMWPNTSLDV